MHLWRAILVRGIWLLCIFGLLEAQDDANVCTQPANASLISPPPEVRSSHGELKIQLSLRAVVDSYKITRYCYVYNNNTRSPTIRVSPGDKVVLILKNDVVSPVQNGHSRPSGNCSGNLMIAGSTNLHFHGLSIPPTCHQDDVLHTAVGPSGGTFEYRFRIPRNHPPGLYWYHPHIHGLTESQVQGGASGALIVEGIELAKPEVAHLPERVLVLRDQISGEPTEDSGEKGEGVKDISLNFVPVIYTRLTPALLRVHSGEREFWRVLNAAADTFFDLQFLFGTGAPQPGQAHVLVPQTFELVAMDGVPSEGGRRNHILLPPGARAEFIVTTPPAGMPGQLVTRYYATGPDGQANPERVIANVEAAELVPSLPPIAASVTSAWSNSAGLAAITPARARKLYFSEERDDLKDPAKPAKYFLTVEGRTPRTFEMNFRKPDIVAEQGTVEDWTIENRAREAHTFHIHQIHFQVVERDGKPVDDRISHDTIDLPYWDGTSAPYPSVKLRLDFRPPEAAGVFVYHCHILEHEDAGMMGSIQVLARGKSR